MHSNGDDYLEKQFIRIFNLFKNDVYRLSYSYTKNISDSDDITQNVFVKLYKHNEVLELDDISIKSITQVRKFILYYKFFLLFD